MSEPLKVSDQSKEGEQKPIKVAAKASTENFTAERQVQPTEKFTTWSSEEPKKVLVAAKPGETLEEFTARTNKYHEELEQKAKQKPPIQPFSIGGFEDGLEVTAGGPKKPTDKLEPSALKNEVPPETVCLDPRPSYVEGLKAIGNDQEAQGKYSIEYIERKVTESQTSKDRPVEENQSEPVLLAHEARKKVSLEGYVSEPEHPFQSFKNLTPEQQNEVITVLLKASQAGQDSLNQQAKDILTGKVVLDFIRSIDQYIRENLGSGTWKERVAHTCQNLQKVAHGEKVGEQESVDKAVTLAAGVVMKAAHGIDQVGQHAHPRAFVSDTHATAEAMRAGIGTASDYYGQRIQNSDLGSIPNDTVDAATYAKERVVKDIKDFADKDVSEQSNVLGMAATIVFLMAATRELITPENARKMRLFSLTEEELEAQGIKKRHIKDMKPEDIVNPIDRAASTETKIAQLQSLSRKNEPLIREFMKSIDANLGTVSEFDLKTAEDIRLKSVRPEILEKKPWFRIEHINDAARFRTPVEDLRDAREIAKMLMATSFEVIKCDIDKVLNPGARGWRSINIDLRAPNGQILEFQILPREMNEAGKAGNHVLYKQWREKDPSTLSRQERWSRLEETDQARELADQAWDSHCAKTKLKQRDVLELLQEVSRVLGGTDGS